MTKSKHPGGRPSVMTKDVVQKLEEAFAMGCSDKEACLFANISPQSLYTYQKNNPDFLERKEQLKETPFLKARTTVVKAAENDVKTAQWYLERKKASEFAQQKQLNVDVTHKYDDKQLLEAFDQVFQQLEHNQSDIIEAEIVTPELEHNPDNEDN